MCLIGNLMREIDVPVLFQFTIMFFCFYFQITLLTLKKLQLEHNWKKKKKAEQQAHEDFAAEKKQDLHHHRASKSRCKTWQVTVVSAETASPKGAPDPCKIFQPLTVKLNFEIAKPLEHWRMTGPVIEITSISLNQYIPRITLKLQYYNPFWRKSTLDTTKFSISSYFSYKLFFSVA